jgi:hypothetical protein
LSQNSSDALDRIVNQRGLRLRRTEWRVRHFEARIAELEAQLRRDASSRQESDR